MSSTPRRVVTVAELEAETEEILDQVAATGELVLVTRHGRPVALIEPVEPKDTSPTPLGVED